MLKFFTFTVIALLLRLPVAKENLSFAQGVSEKTEEAAKDTKRAARRGMHNLKDKTCTLVDGKMSCAGKKLKHKMQNTSEDIGDKVDELKK